MSTETWTLIGTSAATLLLFILPALVYTWYALEQIIGDKKSYPSVTAKDNRRAVR